MKKYSTIFMAVSMVMVFLFSGCGKKNESSQADNSSVVSGIDDTAEQPNQDNTNSDDLINESVSKPTSQSTAKTKSESSTQTGAKTTTKSSEQSTTKLTTKSTTKTTTKTTTKPITKPSTQSTTKPSSGLMGSFSATDVNGKSYNQSMLSGKKLTVVNLWATWCGPCRNELPTLASVSSYYASKGVQIVGVLYIDQTSTASEAKSIVSAAGVNYVNLVNQGDMKKIVKSANGNSDSYSFPTTFCVDSNGNKVGKTVKGAMSEAAWKNYIDSCLKSIS